jgi:beta-glucosidase
MDIRRESDGITYRDLNKNGRLDPYEDPRRPLGERVDDLLSQMTLEEKAGMMFHAMIGLNPDGSLVEGESQVGSISTTDMVRTKKMNTFNVLQGTRPRLMAEWHNRLQALAEGSRLGIPVTIASDPRHSYGVSDNPVASFLAGDFSAWPEPIGLGATDDEALVREFGDMARQEYLAVGIRVALHPMVDLCTEPRWSRVYGCFGEDADLVSRMAYAYIRGFQGDTLGPESVACMTKHFPGGGPQLNGEDPHFHYGREQVYPGGNAEYHLKPFEAAFAAGTAQIMPYYGMPVGTDMEEVGFSYSKGVITDLLRGRFGFDGVVCTDWGLVNDQEYVGGEVMPARAWGVEHLDRHGRVAKIIEAGVDQFGGESCPELVVDLVRDGRIAEDRIDVSVRRLLRDKFRLGLFDNPYVDPDAAERIVGNSRFRERGEHAQRKSIVLLKNGDRDGAAVLPLAGRPRLYVENVDPQVAGRYGEVVSRPEDADIAILRVRAPYEERDKNLLERLFHSGDLDFKEPELSRIRSVLRTVPGIVDIFLERPSVIPEIAAEAAALLGNFGANDAALLDVVFGRFSPSGKLPFELPSSMDAVRRQKEDLPYDSENPLFPFGFGLTYARDRI